MPDPLTPIPTRHLGHLFRSRLEARWATVLEDLGVVWRYEWQGFNLGRFGCYLPDFWLPEMKTWLEIKPEPIVPGSREWKVASRLSDHGFVLVAQGGLPPEQCTGFLDGYHNQDYQLAICPKCGTIGFTFNGWAHRLPCQCFDEQHPCKTPATWARVSLAYEIGRCIQFEHESSLAEVLGGAT